ncbi:MAG: RDD family protein [Patescibacteria group bacterium]
MERIIASPVRRLLGHLIDMAIRLAPATYFVFTTVTSPNIYRQFDSALFGISFIFTFSVLYALLNAYLTSKFGGTIGKIVVGIKVVNEKGGKISFYRAIFRNYIGYTVSSTIAFLGFIWILIDKKDHRAWHDLISGTYVVEA